jgi:preprotein translocase subunit SecG
MVAITIFILIICALLALVVLAQNPKGGGLAAGFTGASQIGGVQRTADFLEKGTWTLSTLLMVLCLVSAGLQEERDPLNELDTVEETATDDASAAPAQDPATTDGAADPAQPPADGQD